MNAKNTLVPFAAAAALLVAGCDDGGGGEPSPDAGGSSQPDGGAEGVDADTAETDAGEEPEDTATALSLGASEDVGIVSTVGIPSLEVTSDVAQGVADSDAVVRRIGEQLYILNRSLGNLTILDDELQLVDQFSLGGDSNPSDVAASGDAIYVAGYGTAGILVLDATDPGAGVVETIDLSNLEPDTEAPNCAALHLDGDRLLASCQRLDSTFSPIGPGVVAVIETGDNSVADTFELARENPLSWLVETPDSGPLGGDLLVASAGAFDAEAGDYVLEDGCIERISTGSQPASEGCLLEHTAIGGWVGRLEVAGGTLWMVATGEEGDFVASYDLAEETLAEPLTAAGQAPSDLALCPEGEIVVADNPFDGARGLRVFAGGQEVADELIDTGANPAFAHGLVCY